MAKLKAIICQNFATIGIPDFEEGESLTKNWSIVGLSEHLIPRERLAGLHQLNTRPLDLVIHNGSKFGLINLQAFKIVECDLATNTIKQCLAHYLTPDGNLLFGVQASGDVVVITDGLQKVKHVRKPVFLKLQQKQSKWYEDIPGKLAEFFGFSRSKTNQVSPDATLRSVIVNGVASTVSAWWQTSSSVSVSSSGVLTENLQCPFPYLTSLPDGLALLCAFSPTDCYIFLSSYETALRVKTIANIRGTEIPGRWFRIIMHKSFIAKWLEDRRTTPVFEARLCYKKNESGESVVGGALLYAVMENLRLELIYGIIKRRSDKFTLSWEMFQFDVDWALRESDGMPYNLGARFVTKLSSDCRKIVVVISNHLGMYVHVQEIPTYTDEPIHLNRQKVSLCNHSDYDGCHFYKQDCWIADVQWLVEDAYFAVMTLCGSLSIFYNTGEPMILKVCKPGPACDENKFARFFFPVFHPHQIVTAKQYQKPKCSYEIPLEESESSTSETEPPQQVYPTIKWTDSEQVLTCSSGMKIELFSIQRVMEITLKEGQREIWLGQNGSEVMLQLDTSRKELQVLDEQVAGENMSTASNISFESSNQNSAAMRVKTASDVKRGYSAENNNNIKVGTPVMEYRYNIDDIDDSNNADDGFEDAIAGDTDVELAINDVDSPSRIEELPPDGGEILEENLEDVSVEIIPTPEKLRVAPSEMNSFDVSRNGAFENPENPQDTEALNFSLPESIIRMNMYNENYSDESSEPDLGAESELARPAEGSSLLPFIGMDNSSSDRKPSQQYLADDEAEEEEDVNRNPQWRPSMRRKAVEKASLAYISREKTATKSINIQSEEESDHHPRSSTTYDTETLSLETYSSPFSCSPTTAEDNEEEADFLPQIDTYTFANKPQQESHGSLVASARSHSSSTTVSLQIPPVPVISGVIVPSERQSAVLMQNIDLSPTTSQQDLMRYKPPPTSTTQPYIDIIHYKSKTAGVIETTTETLSPPREEKADYYTFQGEEEDEEQRGNQQHQNLSTLNGSITVSTPCRYRNSSV